MHLRMHKRMEEKNGEPSLYDHYVMNRGGNGTMISLINKPHVLFSCQLIEGHNMCKCTRVKCTLYAFSVFELYVQGVKINWCKFLMDELPQYCANTSASCFIC